MPMNFEKFQDYIEKRYNFGVMSDATVVAEVGNEKCGDATQLYLKIRDGIIEDAKYFSFGCGFATVVGVILTQLVKGKPVSFLGEVTPEMIESELGEFPQAKAHYSNLGTRLAREALAKCLEAGIVDCKHSEPSRETNRQSRSEEIFKPSEEPLAP